MLLYWKAIIAGALALVIAGLVFWINHLNSVIAVRDDDIVKLTTKLRDQNDAIDKLGADSAAAAVAVQAAQAAASAARAKVVTRVEKIYVQPPSVPSDKCQSALNLLNEVQ